MGKIKYLELFKYMSGYCFVGGILALIMSQVVPLYDTKSSIATAKEASICILVGIPGSILAVKSKMK